MWSRVSARSTRVVQAQQHAKCGRTPVSVPIDTQRMLTAGPRVALYSVFLRRSGKTPVPEIRREPLR